MRNGHISGDNPKDDKLPIQKEKGPQIENSAKLTDISWLLEENDF